MNLAAKYRPKTFDDVTEQKVVVDIVRNICESKNMSNRNFLFVGSAGCGKTSLGRIIANELNEGNGGIIEIDAASHSGVDDMRQLVEQAKQYPVGTNYKVFIVDECFTPDTLVRTKSGLVPIKDVRPGDYVANLSGYAVVSHRHENSVKAENLIYLRVGSREIITTKDHLFFTDEGWVPAKSLTEGDILYDFTEMSAMRSRILRSVPERNEALLLQEMQIPSDGQPELREAFIQYSEKLSHMWEGVLDAEVNQRNNLRSCLWHEMENATSKFSAYGKATFKILASIYLSYLSEDDGDTEQRQAESVLTGMRSEAALTGGTGQSTAYSVQMRMLREYIYSYFKGQDAKDLQSRMSNQPNCMEVENSSQQHLRQTQESDEIRQSVYASGSSVEDTDDEKAEWIEPSQREIDELWQRPLLQSADSSERRVRDRVGVRISSSYTRSEDKSRTYSYELQSRPCLSKIESSSRGGWERPQYEIASVIRHKEDSGARAARVDRVEVYKRGHNDELFQSSFPDQSLLDAEYVTMYDIEVDGHPSYYANDILVHNCHSLSSNSWQVALKCIEEQPAKSVFIWCTTNPEKIPGTILSRVQMFQLSKISLPGIFNRLKYIVDKENEEGANITCTDGALSYIAKLAQGGMRDAITLLDKSLAYTHTINEENLQEALGLPDYTDYFAMLNAVVKKDNASIIAIINKVYNSGVNFNRWFEGFFGFIVNIVKYIYTQDIECTMIPGTYRDKLAGYTTKHAYVCLKLSSTLAKLNKDLKASPYPQEIAISCLCSQEAAK